MAVPNSANPEFEIFGSVVVPNTVDVMHRFPFDKLSSELLFHDEDVFVDSLVSWVPNLDVSVLVVFVFVLCTVLPRSIIFLAVPGHHSVESPLVCAAGPMTDVNQVAASSGDRVTQTAPLPSAIAT